MDETLANRLTSEALATADTLLRESHRLFRPLGLTAAQYNVISVLAGASQGLSQRELGDVLVVDRSNVTGLIDRLEKTGWVARTRDSHDRRIRRVMLTPAGKRIWERARPRYEEATRQVTAALDDRRVRVALEVLQELKSGACNWRLPRD